MNRATRLMRCLTVVLRGSLRPIEASGDRSAQFAIDILVKFTKFSARRLALAVTIHDVAREASVSPATVSLVVHEKGAVSAETRGRVQRVIERLNYIPRTLRGPVGDAVGSVAVICPQSPRSTQPRGRSGIYREWLQGIREHLDSIGSAITVLSSAACADDDPFFHDMLRDGEFCGAVLMGISEDDGYLDAVLPTGLPTVALNREPTAGQFSFVALDNRGGAAMAAEHMHGLGHRRFGFLNFEHGEKLAAHRLDGFNRGLRDAGHDEPMVLSADLDDEEADFDHLLSRFVKGNVTGVLAYNDHLAVALASAVERAGLVPGADLSIVGFDHAKQKTPAGRSPTTVACDALEMGKAAGRMIQQLVGASPRRAMLAEVFAAELIEGDTTGEARSATAGATISRRTARKTPRGAKHDQENRR